MKKSQAPTKKPSPPPEKSGAAPSPLIKTGGKFNNPLTLQNAVAAVFGKRGSGKTVLACKLVKDFPRVVCYDPRGQCLEKFQEMGLEPDIVRSPKEFVETCLKRGPKKFLICWLPESVQDDFACLAWYIRGVGEEIPFRETVFLVDEVSMVCDTFNIDKNFEHILRFGRHAKIGLIMTAQRPVDVNRDLTAQCNHLFIFHQHEPNDIKYFSGFLGEGADDLQDLQDHSFLYSDFKQKLVVDKTGNIL